MQKFLVATADRVRRTGQWMRDAVVLHPWRTAMLPPALVLAYVLVLLPFTPSIGDVKKSKQEQPSVVLSADGKELAVFKRANRDWVKLEDISPHVVTALLATEDHRFYEHPGLDFKRTAKAVLNTLQGEREGGSTLTQQLARNLYPEEIGRAPTITRKVKEAITALKIEAVYSKDEILETYLNSVSFLYNAWGIEMAARTYFDKPAKKLNEAEAATLVGMLKGTSYYNPVLNPERAVERRNLVLAQMVRHGKLADARYEKLKEQPLKLDFSRIPEFNGPAPHLAEHLRRWLIDWAERHDYNIYADGLVVHTTIDSRLQARANEAVKRQGDALQAVADVEWSRSGLTALGSDPKAYENHSRKVGGFEYFWNSRRDLVNSFIKETPEYRQARESGVEEKEALEQLRADASFMKALRESKTRLQAGFLAIEPSTGHIKAWVGSRGYNEDKFDHVQQARRQPGSTFKPFVYGAAFEQGMSPSQVLMDAPVEIRIDRNKVWRPTDVAPGPTNQPMTLREGLARSKNTITAQLMMQVGPSRVASLARAMGVRQSKLDEVPSLALGTSPVTLKEMVTAFASIANTGSYIQPVLVTSVQDRSGNLLESFGAPPSETAMSSQAAMTLLDVMRGVVEEGTAVGLRHRFGITGDVAGKTGTTQDNTDGWFILMHPQLVAGAWVGFNDNRVAMRSEYWGQGSHNALLVVGDFFQQSAKANLVDMKRTFAAPRQKDIEAPLLDRMNDWFNSVFSTPPATADTTVVASPPVQLDPPMLEPPPSEPITVAPSISMAPSGPLFGPPPAGAPVAAYPPPPDAPVVVDNQRVPDFPRPLESTLPPSSSSSGRPAATVPGTQVYTQPAPAPDWQGSSSRRSQEAVLVPRPLRPSDGSASSSSSSSSSQVTVIPGGSGRSQQIVIVRPPAGQGATPSSSGSASSAYSAPSGSPASAYSARSGSASSAYSAPSGSSSSTYSPPSSAAPAAATQSMGAGASSAQSPGAGSSGTTQSPGAGASSAVDGAWKDSTPALPAAGGSIRSSETVLPPAAATGSATGIATE